MMKRTIYCLSICLWLGSILALQAQSDSANIKGATSKTDSKTKQQHTVLANIKLTAGTTQRLDMVYATGVNYSFIPAHVASALRAKKIGEIDLAQKDPEIPAHLGLYNMNQTGQTRFQIVRVDKFDLGVGPTGGPVDVLVLDDKNSDFGIIGLHWPLKTGKKQGYTYFSDERYPHGALSYGRLPTQTMQRTQ
jgi:hypothetical protein